jgi:hypothetical protein
MWFELDLPHIPFLIKIQQGMNHPEYKINEQNYYYYYYKYAMLTMYVPMILSSFIFGLMFSFLGD